MNKKGMFATIIGMTVCLLVLGTLWYCNYLEYKDYKAYDSFCNTHQELCFCEKIWGIPISCEFKLHTQYINGQLNYTNNVELCALAEKLNDKKMMFKSNCITNYTLVIK